ncbi:HPr family phosphocarrier protein [Neorhodopirellula pilleata]|uniref:Phosphocarrier protein HPr n=1 Tax=Neorhodopirellula pilleata TaxID=2714738 RepID=A0A5C6ADS5_9BACT|nr:HPr family phosphocarrier protein [Neorhodopirellula pilleata]TWT96393.1 Phosphocarrier protein HPr [Neorhodopirellula pilleata]
MNSTSPERPDHLEHTVRVINPQGLHARPADLLVRCADEYESVIHLQKGSETVDCRSILSLLTLGATEGTDLRVTVQGADAVEAMAAICELFERGFHELESPTQSSITDATIAGDGH